MGRRAKPSYEETLHNVSRYPLTWPANWPVTAASNRREARFGKRAGRRISVVEGLTRLLREAYRVGATNVVVSTNVPVRKDGSPMATEHKGSEPGAAAYFVLSNVTCCFACDKWDRVGDNLTAIASHIKALRDQLRWGVGTIEQAFRGYSALPESFWWDVLGVTANATRKEAQAAYRAKAREVHPDKSSGDHDTMTKLNHAWETAQKYFESLDEVTLSSMDV